VLLLLTGVRLLKLPEILYKNEVIHPSSYSMNTYVQRIIYYSTSNEKSVAEIFGRSRAFTL
jgi:hypothetical protein